MFFRPNDLPTAERISKGLGSVEKVSRKVTSSGQIVEEKEKYPLLSLDELTNLDPTELVAFKLHAAHQTDQDEVLKLGNLSGSDQ